MLFAAWSRAPYTDDLSFIILFEEQRSYGIVWRLTGTTCVFKRPTKSTSISRARLRVSHLFMARSTLSIEIPFSYKKLALSNEKFQSIPQGNFTFHSVSIFFFCFQRIFNLSWSKFPRSFHPTPSARDATRQWDVKNGTASCWLDVVARSTTEQTDLTIDECDSDYRAPRIRQMNMTMMHRSGDNECELQRSSMTREHEDGNKRQRSFRSTSSWRWIDIASTNQRTFKNDRQAVQWRQRCALFKTDSDVFHLARLFPVKNMRTFSDSIMMFLMYLFTG